MRPAFSVLLLTTLIGAAQGLFLALFSVEIYAMFDLLPAPAPRFYAVGSAIALVLLAGGLLASFFHLGRPERAWRSAAMWRTSWLSREVIVLPAFMGAVMLYGIAHLSGFDPTLLALHGGAAVTVTTVLGVVGTLLAFALFVCTAMIYACLKFLREWHSPLTVVNYILLGGASGFTLAAAYAAVQAPDLVDFFVAWALILTLGGLVSRGAALIRNARLRPVSTAQTAIGIKHPRIAQTSQGFMGGAFNTREFFHGRTGAFLRSVKWLFLAGAFLVPAVLLATTAVSGATVLLVLAFAIQYVGLLAERWHFFAEANHPQNLYYQAIA